MRKSFLFPAICALPLVSVAADEGPQEKWQRVEFKREILLRISPPCTLSSEGSKLTVYPQETTFAEFTKDVSWEHGVPGYLVGTDPTSKSFDFDLMDTVTFRKEVVIRVVRTTIRVTDGGVILVAKGSRMPRAMKEKEAASP